MSPIFVRPVREQLEHDRLIRFLQLKYKRKFEALINVGEERIAPVKIGTGTFFPDLVLMEGKKLAGVVEVESGESVNNLEAMAQWVHFARARVPFHLYVPVTGYDAARRLCEAYKVRVTEVWTYRPAAEGFDLVRMWHDAVGGRLRPPAPAAASSSGRGRRQSSGGAERPPRSPRRRRAHGPTPRKAALRRARRKSRPRKPAGSREGASPPPRRRATSRAKARAKAAKKPAKKAKPASRKR